MRLSGKQELLEQISFLGYYFHWTPDIICDLPNRERKSFCREISRINRKANGDGKNIFEL